MVSPHNGSLTKFYFMTKNSNKNNQKATTLTVMKRLLLAIMLLGAFSSCEKDDFISDYEEMETRAPKKKKTRTYKLNVDAEENSESATTRLYDADLVWHWAYGDALTGYQVAYDNIRNRLAYDPATKLFSDAEFTYQSSSPEHFHFIYPAGAEFEKGKLRAIQDGNWRPMSYFTTTDKVQINEIPVLKFEQLTSALELRIWNMNNTALQERVVSAVLTSDSDFVGLWTLDETDMTYTQSLSGKEMVIKGLNSSVMQINMPHLPEGYPAGTEIKLVLTREDGRTMTTTLPAELTYVKQKRTVYNMIFVPDPIFVCATYNVDGLPSLINSDGPGANGTKTISTKLAASGWDFIGFQEDFEYHSNLTSQMSSKYIFGKHRGSVGLEQLYKQADTDGLEFATLGDNCTWSNETFVEFTNKYGDLFDGANTCIKKGFRYYLVTMNDGVEFDVYVTHMNSGSDTGHINARASQFQQLAKYINEHRSGRPIIIMGDFNARYTRDDYATNFWNKLNTDLYANLQDAWTELIWGGYYPEYPSNSWVVEDKYDPNNTVGDIKYGEQEGEVVDKILYINDPNSTVRIFAKSYKRDMEYSGLADHVPVVVEFGYEKISE